MTDPVLPAPHAPHAKKPWATPSLARIASSSAENSANPDDEDGISFGS